MKSLDDRSLQLIKDGKIIVLKRNDGWYLHQWTNIAAGPDAARWGLRGVALEMFSLEWAFVIAKLYKCKVFSVKR